jgi:hypothetical protein
MVGYRTINQTIILEYYLFYSAYLSFVISIPPSLHLGPLRTRAKSRDHEIVRAQKKVSKGRPNTPPKSCSVVIDPQV